MYSKQATKQLTTIPADWFESADQAVKQDDRLAPLVQTLRFAKAPEMRICFREALQRARQASESFGWASHALKLHWEELQLLRQAILHTCNVFWFREIGKTDEFNESLLEFARRISREKLSEVFLAQVLNELTTGCKKELAKDSDLLGSCLLYRFLVSPTKEALKELKQFKRAEPLEL